MTDLVPKVTDHRSVRLVEAFPIFFAIVGVGLRHIDRDQAVGMAGHHA